MRTRTNSARPCRFPAARAAASTCALGIGLASLCAGPTSAQSVAGLAAGAAPGAATPLAELPAATPITLSFKEAAPREVLESIIQQAKLAPLGRSANSLLNNKKDTITLDVQAQPFWLAVRALHEASGIGFDEFGPSSDEAVLGPTVGDRGLRGRMQSVGPVLLVVNSIEAARARRVELGNEGAAPTPAAENLEVRLHAFLDPALRIVPRTARLEITQAQDEAGRPLLALPATIPINSSGRFSLGTRLRLDPAPEGAKSLSLKGTLRVLLAEQPQVWEVTDLSATPPAKLDAQPANRTPDRPEGDPPAQTKSVGNTQNPILLGFDYLAQPAARPGQFYARVSFQREGGVAGAEAGVALGFRETLDAMLDDVKLVDAAGRELRGQPGAASGTRGVSDPNAASQRYISHVMFPRSGRAPQGFVPAKLVWSVPGRLREIAIPWSFEGLPLP